MPEYAQDCLNDGSPFDKANFLYQHALKYSTIFIMLLQDMFQSTDFVIKGNIKSNS